MNPLITIAALGILTALSLLYALLEPFLLDVRKHEIVSSQVPDACDGLTIALVADIHYGPFFTRQRVRRLVERVNGLSPDIILLGGDYSFRNSRYIEPLFTELSSLRAAKGAFGVLGNHDYWLGPGQIQAGMDLAGIKVLENEAVWVDCSSPSRAAGCGGGDSDSDSCGGSGGGGDGGGKVGRIRLGGVADVNEGSPDLAPIFECDANRRIGANKRGGGLSTDGATDNYYVILLTHNPDLAERVDLAGIDLVLAGHTHGGQITVFGLWAPFTSSRYGQKYRGGVTETDDTTVIVTRGVGTVRLPMRFFARPEITIVKLTAPSS